MEAVRERLNLVVLGALALTGAYAVTLFDVADAIARMR